jgi:alpha-L-fucosidase
MWTFASAEKPTVVQMQKDFLDLKFGMFLHYKLATYKGAQWVAGYHSPADFDPGVETIDTDGSV